MNVKKLLFCWSVAVIFIALFAGCTRRIEQNITAPPAPQRSRNDLIAEQIMERIRSFTVSTKFRAGGEPIYAGYALSGFYAKRHYCPAWSDDQGFTRPVDDLVNAIRKADGEGLRPNDYHLVVIETLVEGVRSDMQKGLEIAPDRWAEIDLLISDAFLMYGCHLQPGRIHPNPILQFWVPTERSVALAAVLEDALASDTFSGALSKLAPSQEEFRRLRETLARYRALALKGGWPTISESLKLKPGDHGPFVKALRERLTLGGDLVEEQVKNPDQFDETLEQALKRFQQRHGLKADGTLGEETRAELNVSVERRVEQLEVNLERWRQAPQDLGPRYIMVNIPAFMLDVVEDGAKVMDMRVVVGKFENTTPVFSDTIRHIVLNPYWSVPPKIAVNEMLPRLKRDPAFTGREKMRVFQGAEIDPGKIKWSAISPADFHFQLRQEPGPYNPLGRIKFVFLNKFNVYLHDTPTKQLFNKQQRDFSHGCIRIEKATELALYLLRKDPHWNRETLERALKSAKDRWVPLPEEIPIHLVYRTAWVDEDGTVQFRRDVYGWDASFLGAMQASPPDQK